MKKRLENIIYNTKEFNYSFHKIKTLLNVSHHDVNDELLQILKELELEGKLFLDEDNLYKNMPSNYRVVRIVENKYNKYSAFLNGKKTLVKHENLNGALHNDIVITKIDNDKECKVVKILKRFITKVVCEVKINEDGQKYLELCNVNPKFTVTIGEKNMDMLTEGQRILVNIGEDKYNGNFEGEFIETIGYKNDPNIDLKGIAIANGFSLSFSMASLDEANSIPSKVKPKELRGRLDLRGEKIFTIDGERTKDIDDAISIKKLANKNFELGVHIAHVSHYVKMDSGLFKEAFERGNSLYLLDSVIPMLPQHLSNGICSLNENADRLTRSVIMEFDNSGNVINYRIVKSVINSKKKMEYKKVNDLLENNIVHPGYEDFVEDLKLMQELSGILSNKKDKQGYINFDSSEAEFNTNLEGKIDSVEVKKQHSAESMIENFMVAANCTVASHYYWQNLPFAYRNHGIPNSQRFMETVKLLSSFGYKLEKVCATKDPHTVQKTIKSLMDKEEFPVLSTLILSSMKSAHYATDNMGHYGLAEDTYTHFTSPIRRLIDLTIHNLIDLYEEENAYEKINDTLLFELKSICKQATFQEKNAKKAEYQSYKLACVELMEDKIGQNFESFVTKISNRGISIKSADLVEGVIPLIELGIDYHYNEKNHSIYLPSIGQTIIIGSKINVTLIEASKEARELYFTFSDVLEMEKEEARVRKIKERFQQ